MVLQGAGDDLARRGGAAIDQHRYRQPARDVAGPGIVALRLLGTLPASRDDLALFEKGVGDSHRLIEQAAGVVTQIEDDADQLVVGLLLQILHRIVEADIGLLVERGDTDIADVVAFEMRADRLDLDNRAGQLDVERFLAFAAYGQVDIAVDRAPHLLDGLRERQTLHRVAVEMGDQIARLQAGMRGRRVVDRRDDLYESVLHRHFDAEPAELAAGLHLHVIEVFGVEVIRMRIERGQHAVDRALDQLIVLDLIGVTVAHDLEHIAEQVELLVGLGRVRRGGRRRRRTDILM